MGCGDGSGSPQRSEDYKRTARTNAENKLNADSPQKKSFNDKSNHRTIVTVPFLIIFSPAVHSISIK